ncbi:unnamed protein product [Musa hybrid cultivar]
MTPKSKQREHSIIDLLYNYQTATEEFLCSSIFLLGPRPLRHGYHEHAAGIRGGGQRRPGGGRQPEPPSIELEPLLEVDAAAVPYHNLHHPGVYLDRVGSDVAPEIVSGRDKPEALGVLLDGYVGIGLEGKLQDLAEDVGQAAELLLPVEHGCGGGRRIHVVAEGDVPLPGCWMNPHTSCRTLIYPKNLKSNPKNEKAQQTPIGCQTLPEISIGIKTRIED